MTGSRTAHNAKLVRRHQRQQSSTLAKSSANRFTQKQSHFERRREEEQLSQQAGAGGSAAVGTTRNVGDGLLSRGGGGGGGAAAGDRAGTRSGRYTPAEEEVRETPNPFARSRTPNGGNAASLSASTRSATMGLERAVKSTRTTRRIGRFQLAGGSGAADASAADASSLMGVRRVRAGESAEPDEGDSGGAAPPLKMSRAEKFREVVSKGREKRVQLQRERAERDAATIQLDAEINSLLHLLPKRNKTEEEQVAFAQSGTPEVRALLASYRRGHEAKCLTLKSSGDFEVRTLAAAARAPYTPVGGDKHAAQTQASAEAGACATPEGADPTAPKDSMPGFLDAADRALLAQIRSGAARSTEEEEAEGIGMAATAHRLPTSGLSRQVMADAAEARAAPLRRAVTDDFDAVMNSFQLDPRRAHAVARTLTEEEEAARDARQLLLREDRQLVPSLNLQERDQTQLTRGEWVEQGGDVAFQMDEGGTEREDNVDIPSSFEGDSEADDLDGDSDDGGVAGAVEEGAAAEAKATERVSGSLTLDHLLEELEELATTATTAATDDAVEGTQGPKRLKQLHSLLVRLHRYASSHVVEATKAFRLILVEAERSFLRGTRRGGVRRTLLVYLYAITKVFPTSDYRHEVTTAFMLFLCSSLMQMKLDSLEAVHSYLVLTTLLLHCLKAGAGRYCAEVVVATLNVLALQLPRSVLEPIRYQGSRLPIPLVDRPEAVLLSSSPAASPEASDAAAASKEDRPAYQIGILDTTHDPQRLLLCAYRIFDELCEVYRATPAFPVMCATPFLRLDALLLQPHGPAASL
ncbi:hypothetical protein ABL78_6826, partial [Leptomonas seymouri]